MSDYIQSKLLQEMLGRGRSRFSVLGSSRGHRITKIMGRGKETRSALLFRNFFKKVQYYGSRSAKYYVSRNGNSLFFGGESLFFVFVFVGVWWGLCFPEQSEGILCPSLGCTLNLGVHNS